MFRKLSIAALVLCSIVTNGAKADNVSALSQCINQVSTATGVSKILLVSWMGAEKAMHPESTYDCTRTVALSVRLSRGLNEHNGNVSQVINSVWGPTQSKVFRVKIKEILEGLQVS